MSLNEKIADHLGINKYTAQALIAGYGKAHDGKVSYKGIVDLVDKAGEAMANSAIKNHDCADMEHELLHCGWNRQLDAIWAWGGQAGDVLIAGIRCGADELAWAAFVCAKSAAQDILLSGGPEGWKHAVKEFGVSWHDAEDFEIEDSVGRMFAAEGTEKDFRAYMDCPRRISDVALAAIRDAMAEGRETHFSRSGVMGMLRELKNACNISSDVKTELEAPVIRAAVEGGYAGWRDYQDPLTSLLRMRHIPEKEELLRKYCAATPDSGFRNAVCLLEEAYGEKEAVDLAAATLAKMPVDGEDHITRLYEVICPSREEGIRNTFDRFLEVAKAENEEGLLTPERYMALVEETGTNFSVGEDWAYLCWNDPITGKNEKFEMTETDADELRKLAAWANMKGRELAFERMRLIECGSPDSDELTRVEIEDRTWKSSEWMRCIASHRNGRKPDVVVINNGESRMQYDEIGTECTGFKKAYVSEVSSIGRFSADISLRYGRYTCGGHGPGDFDNQGGYIWLDAGISGRSEEWTNLMNEYVRSSFLGGSEPDAIKWAHNWGTVFPDSPSPEDCLVNVAAFPETAVRALIECPPEKPAEDIWALCDLLESQTNMSGIDNCIADLKEAIEEGYEQLSIDDESKNNRNSLDVQSGTDGEDFSGLNMSDIADELKSTIAEMQTAEADVADTPETGTDGPDIDGSDTQDDTDEEDIGDL